MNGGTVALLVAGPVAAVFGVVQLAGWLPPALETRRERRVFGTAFLALGVVCLGVGVLQALTGWGIG